MQRSPDYAAPASRTDLRERGRTALAAGLNGTAEQALLLCACRRGDPTGWNSLIRSYQKPAYKFAYTLCHNYDDAADIAAQAFLRLYEIIHTFRNEPNFTSWLFRIVRNACVDTCLRAPHRQHVSLDEGLDIEGDLVPAEMVRAHSL